MKTGIAVLASVISLAATLPTRAGGGATVTVNGQSPGPTPFINFIDLTVNPPDALKNIEFMVEPKPSSVTRPVTASYSSAYLQSRGYLDVQTGHATLPVFGLYANFSNTVWLSYQLTGGSAKPTAVPVQTAAFDDPTGVYTNPTVVQARSTSTKLSYDYVLLKSFAASNTPIIVDTDGEVRWVGTANIASTPSILFDNGIYISSVTGIVRLEFDGTSNVVTDYYSLGINSTGHHNYDYGKFGIILDINTTSTIESVNIEIDRDGNILKSWDAAEIISAAMIAGGDDPSGFVVRTNDWFHNNATTYRKSDDSVVMSGREDFVLCVDYDTSAIKWILGDPTKAWYQYPSLKKYAVALKPGSLPPIGQHAVSITKDNSLLLFDNGAESLNQTPAGTNRTYSAARKYKIKSLKKPAKEVWNYTRGETISSPYCSSIYEDKPKNYLIDYSMGGPFLYTKLVGLDKQGNVVFDYEYPAINGCATAWNAQPIHLENLVFP
jgi:arylsulfate sulfotransferase